MSREGDMETRPRILIVDDDPKLLMSLHALLRGRGFDAEWAESGALALQRLAREPFDVLLLDLQMPVMDGLEVLRRLRSLAVDCKVIVVSGQAQFISVRTALKSGAYDFVRKPYLPDELVTTIDNAWHALELERQNTRVWQALRESEQLHRYIVNHSPDIVYVLDKEGRFTFLNDRVEALLGYPREQLLGRHYSFLVHEDDLQAAHYVFNERRTGRRASRNVELRLRINNDVKEFRNFNTYTLSIELNSVGMYRPEGDKGEGVFVGTYGCARDITERKRSEEMINFQAYHDLLTGLPNRALFRDRLHQAMTHAKRYQRHFAIIFIDLDRLKLVNDTLGHSMGDKLLQLVADRILGCLRAEDTLARFGGDEFTLLLPEVSCQEDATSVVKKIIASLGGPILLDQHELYISASIGIALYPENGETQESLLKSADIAMYQVKSNGKNGFCFYSEAMCDLSSGHLAMERDLNRALEKEQFEIFFQPKVNADDCRITGMEALVRWRHPERGLVFPGEFIHLAETTRLIVPIGDWIFRATCQEVARWRSEGIPPVKVSVNISPLQLERNDFVEKILGTLDDFGLSADGFELEITEHGIMLNHEQTVAKLKQLARYGFTIAIDDFGTGYSSLNYLRQFPVNTLKIDRSFVQDIADDTRDTCIVDAIAYMAKGLKLHMVAEGVESLPQLEYLKSLGCFEVQGHLFGAARSAGETMTLLSESPGGRLQSCLLASGGRSH